MQPDSTPAADMSINFVWDEENETYWIVWDPDVTVTSADATTTSANAVYVTHRPMRAKRLGLLRLSAW